MGRHAASLRHPAHVQVGWRPAQCCCVQSLESVERPQQSAVNTSMDTAEEAAAASVLIQEASLASGAVQETVLAPGPPAESPLASLCPLQESLLAACKSGDLAVVADCVQRGADINCCRGWPLRRAVRYNRAQVWQFLVSRAEVRARRYNNSY